jgi:predicted nucleic acid-binding protein
MAGQGPSWRTHRPDWISVEPLSDPHAATAEAWRLAGLLDTGEAEAISLARQINADWLLTDDAAARLFASALGKEVHGSLGIVLWAAANAHLDHAEASSILNALASSSLWIAARVMAEARDALAQIFRGP